METQISNIVRFTLFFISCLFLPTAFAYQDRETLQEAYLYMLNTNPNLLESQANEQAAWQAYQHVRGGMLPTLALAYNVGRGKGESTSPQTFSIGYTTENIQHKGITLTQLLFDGGSLANKVASAKNQHAAAEMRTALQMNVLALRVASAYLSILRNEEMTAIARENLRAHLHRVGQAEDRYRGGASILSELVMARSKLEQARLVLHQSELDLANARSAYREVVGHYPVKPLAPAPEPAHVLPPTLVETEYLSKQVNPSILAEKQAMIAAHHDVNAAKAVVYWPNVALQVSATRDNNQNGILQKTTSMQGYLAFTYNIYNGGADVADMAKACALYNASKEHLESKEREVNLAIEQTWNEMKIAQRDVASLRKHLVSSQEVVESVSKELQVGKRSLLEVMESENELYNVRLALVNTKYKIKIDAYSLLANAGLLANYLLNKPAGSRYV